MKKSVTKTVDKTYTNPMRFYRFCAGLLSGVVKVLFRTEITGRENMPKEGACFVCCNHLSNWDPVFLAVAVKRPLHFMAKKELFSIPFVKWLVKVFGAFPIDRNAADLTAIKTTIMHIRYGNAVGIFPQGTRCMKKPPEEMPIKNGTGLMVYKTETDVVPVSIYTEGYKVSLFKKVYINIGKPIRFEDYSVGEKSPAEYQRISDVIFGKICSLAKESEAKSVK